MEIPGGEQGFTVLDDPMMYGEMCHKLAVLVQKIIEIFPSLEAVQPRKAGMQALCDLHWALDKAKSFLQQIVHSSKLYLAVTSDSVCVKFEKVKECLDQSLRLLELNVPEGLAQQVSLLLAELQERTFHPNALGQEVGREIISLLQKEKEVPGFNALTELDVFDRAALKLGILSGKAVLTERKALRRLLDKARNEEDKKKELILLYLLHLLRKFCKVQKFSFMEDGSSPETTTSCPPSPSERGSEASTSGRGSDLSSELCCFEVYQKQTRDGCEEALSCLDHVSIPPEEFRCPISLQLMSDPVIISSGQTYERVCIEKWFEKGHDTCPKTQQKLTHLVVTPNYCVKGLIASWCEKHLIPIPSPPSPPPSPGANWRWEALSKPVSTKDAYSQCETVTPLEIVALSLIDAESVGTLDVNEDCQSVHPSSTAIENLAARDSSSSMSEANPGERVVDDAESIQILVGNLHSSSLDLQCRAVEGIRLLAKDNADARLRLGESGLIPALVLFLSAAIKGRDENAQKIACLALLNIAVNNNRNKAEIVNTGAIPLLLELLGSDISLATREAAVVVLLTASCLDENKPVIGSSGAVPFLVDHLGNGSAQGVKDALTTLFNLSIYSGNHLHLVKAGAVAKLILLLNLGEIELREKCTAILYNLTSIEEAKLSMVEAESCISCLAEILDVGTQREKEHVAAILLVLCTNSSQHSQLVLKEGVIPSLVMLSVNGSVRGKDKAKKLLQHFREQRQKECVDSIVHPSEPSNGRESQDNAERDTFWKKSRSRSSFGFFRRSKSFSFPHC